MQTTKPLHIEWADKVLMAPWRLMDMAGNNPHASPLVNFINRPSTRALVVSTAAACALHSNVRDMAVVIGAAIYSTTFAKLAEIKFPSRPFRGVHIDTAPESIAPLEARQMLAGRNENLLGFSVRSFAYGAFPASIVTLAGASPLTAGCVGAVIALHSFMPKLTTAYRNNRLKEGDWALVPGDIAPPQKAASASPALKPIAF